MRPKNASVGGLLVDCGDGGNPEKSQSKKDDAVTTPFPSRMTPLTDHFGRKDFLPVEPQGGLSFLFLLSEPRFA
jgi:hypothetical protein